MRRTAPHDRHERTSSGRGRESRIRPRSVRDGLGVWAHPDQVMYRCVGGVDGWVNRRAGGWWLSLWWASLRAEWKLWEHQGGGERRMLRRVRIHSSSVGVLVVGVQVQDRARPAVRPPMRARFSAVIQSNPLQSDSVNPI